MHAIMFHHFHDENNYIKSQGSINFEEMSAMIDYYKYRGYTFLNASDWFSLAVRGKIGKKQVAITFDDGLKCQMDIGRKVLAKHGLTGFFYVPTKRFEDQQERLEIIRDFRFRCFPKLEDFYHLFFQTLRNTELSKKYEMDRIMEETDFEQYLNAFPFYTYEDRKFRYIRDKVLTETEYYSLMDEMMKAFGYDASKKSKELYMDEDDVRKLAQEGHHIGLHSHSHYTNLAEVSDQRQIWEYHTNKKILEEIISKRITSASYPCNSYNSATLKIMKDLEIRLAFRANMEKGYSGVLELPREDHSNIIRRMKDENYGIYQ